MTDQEKRELDAWISEHVMGWHRMTFDNGFPGAARNQLVPEKFRADQYRKHGWRDGIELLDTFPKFTTDPAAAMAVLKKCAERCDAEICLRAGKWIVTGYCLSDVKPGQLDWDVAAPTLELAICLYAKKLFGE